MPSRRAVLRSLGALAATVTCGCLATDGSGTEGPATAEPPADDPTVTGSATSRTPTANPSAEPSGTPVPPERVEGEWPAPAHDPGLSNHAPGSTGPTEPVAELWSVTADGALSDPVLAGGTLFVGGDGAVRALDARTGADRWRASVDGTAGTPWVVGDVLVVPAAGALVALDRREGSERWRVETPDRVAVVATEHGVYALSDARDGPPSLVARDVSDGRRRWEVELGDPSETTLLATPDAVVVPTGTRFPRPWVFDPATGESLLPKPDESGHHFHGVRYALDGVAYATDPFYGSVSAHTVSGGGYDSRWRAAFDGPGGKRVAGDPDRLYGAVRSEPRGVHALSTADGSTVWEADGVDELRSRPVVAAGAVLVRTATGLRCLDPTDGSERWARSAEGVGDRVVVADDLVYTTRGETLRAFRPP